MKIEILGTGCKNCKKQIEIVSKAVFLSGRQDIEIVKVEDMVEIMKHGVMRTPALVIDGQVKIVGRVADVGEIEKLLKSEAPK